MILVVSYRSSTDRFSIVPRRVFDESKKPVRCNFFYGLKLAGDVIIGLPLFRNKIYGLTGLKIYQ